MLSVFCVLKLISGTNGLQVISPRIRLDEMHNGKMIAQNGSICSIQGLKIRRLQTGVMGKGILKF